MSKPDYALSSSPEIISISSFAYKSIIARFKRKVVAYNMFRFGKRMLAKDVLKDY